MPDVYANIAEADPAIVERIADALETRVADPAQRAMLNSYLVEATFPSQALVLEIGCGTGAIARVLACQPGVTEVVGIDPSPTFLERAERLGTGVTNLRFMLADGRALPFDNATFDIVVMHTLLCHSKDQNGCLKKRVACCATPAHWPSLTATI
jgi:arsenite methyltransferase